MVDLTSAILPYYYLVVVVVIISLIITFETHCEWVGHWINVGSSHTFMHSSVLHKLCKFVMKSFKRFFFFFWEGFELFEKKLWDLKVTACSKSSSYTSEDQGKFDSSWFNLFNDYVEKIYIGVPQVSVLGPKLFSNYTRPVGCHIIYLIIHYHHS